LHILRATAELHEEVGKVNDAAGVVFEALADPTRRRVVYELSKDGPLTATELAKRIPVTRQAIAKHFAALEEAELAVGVHVGRETRYELRTQAFAEAEAWMRAIGATWDQRLARFKEFVESVPSGAEERGQR
jgi:ArsR family transcriptional regulator, cadmium/lead-responsive transcriptional repressor